MLLNCSIGEDSCWRRLQENQTSQFWRKSVLNIHWKDWCWSWSSSTSATWCEELTHWKRPWFWERLKAGGEGNDRGWDGWMTSQTRWTWVWASSGNWWWTGKPGVVQSMGLQRVKHNWVTELKWWQFYDPGKMFHTYHLDCSSHKLKDNSAPWEKLPTCEKLPVKMLPFSP